MGSLQNSPPGLAQGYAGATNKSIGEELFLATRTVEAHVHKIFHKLGVSSRTEAVTQAIRDGLIKNSKET